MDQCIHQALAMAESLINSARDGMTRDERRNFARIQALIEDPEGMAFTIELIDRAFRDPRTHRQAQRLRNLLHKYGTPHYLSHSQALLMNTGAALSKILPRQVMPILQHQLRHDSARVILPAEDRPLTAYLAKRSQQGMRLNLNLLGEAVLGEEEAERRLENILKLLERPDVNYASIKISTLFSQINSIDWEGSLDTLKQRLRRLYTKALELNKFINLDMEEYRDLSLTLAAFQQTLDEPDFFRLPAGIVLQAYIPDSWHAQQQLTGWAHKRVALGGAPIKLRLVKGANLAMEKVEAELQGWYPATYDTKAETDANYRRMLDYACQPDHAKAVHIGVASHNLFDICLALTLRESRNVHDQVEIEMLEGMANHQARAIRETSGDLLLYAPVVRDEDYNSALAYLVRRLDENTQPDNFLRDLFGLSMNSPAWESQKQRFILGWNERKQVSDKSRRETTPPPPETEATSHFTLHTSHFHNTPNTDWTQEIQRRLLGTALDQYKKTKYPRLAPLEQIIETANTMQEAWQDLGFEKRAELLLQAANTIESNRMATIACMVHEANKAPYEADIEVSEAADFARCYARYRPMPGLTAEHLGTVLIVPPWNFPYAIPAGGILAALMAGNSVILKPAPETRGIAWHLCQQLWNSGIPHEALQFFPCDDDELGKALICHKDINAVILTGAWQTAHLFHSWRPDLLLFAETSGKNALIITAQSDRDLAIKDLVKSAFGHSGQKCSAASLAILEAAVYDDPNFMRQLRDAAASLPVGPSTHPASIVTPLVQAPSGKPLRALTQLDENEEWLLKPRPEGEYNNLWTPGIRLGVQPGSWFHHTECFGPVLGLMRAPDLQTATAWQNAVPYGLTGGIHSLDEDEITWWKNHVEVGNAYINRSITGAIVTRQPFGGWKCSCIGPGLKAGDTDYVSQFLRLENHRPLDPVEEESTWQNCWKSHFLTNHDPSALHCESNILRYRPLKGLLLRIPPGDTHSINWAHLAARISGIVLIISKADEESEESLINRLPEISKICEAFRSIITPGLKLLEAIHDYELNWINAPILNNPRTELLRWTRQQTISETRHRYGLLF